MKKKQAVLLSAFLVLLALFWPNVSYSQNKHCIWQVNGLHNTVFLVGSVHLLTKDQYPLPAVFDSVYQQSDSLIFEMNLDSVNVFNSSVQIMQAGLLPSTQTLKDVLADSVFNELGKTLAELGQPMILYLKMKPWLVSLMLDQLAMQKLKFNPDLGLESFFFKKAKKDGKPIHGFETFKQQLKLLQGLAAVNSDQLILETIAEIKGQSKDLQLMLTAWRNGNASTLDSLVNAGFSAFPQLKKVLLQKRNGRWLKQIERFLHGQKNYLIVVGAGHLVGESGLVALLRQKGYTVKQL